MASSPEMLFLLTVLSLTMHTVESLNQEGLYLLQAKLALDDPNSVLRGWNPRDPTPCNWTGVGCSPSLAVTSLDLYDAGLTGPFPAVLCRLPSLAAINLGLNYINGTLPSASLLPCPALSRLDLSQNFLVGPLPPSLASLPNLTFLDLSGNNFTGDIPASFGLFPNLQVLSLTANLLSGTIPAFLGNVSTLRQLNLSYNPFAAAPLPPQLWRLENLENLWLADCMLVGSIPPAMGGLQRLRNFDLSSNALTGPIPTALANLTSLVQVELYFNSLSGPVPAGFSNLTALLRIDAAMNSLSGPIPPDIFESPLIQSLHLYNNRFSGEVPATVSKSRKLVELTLFGNRLVGDIPPDLGRDTPLMYLDLSDNFLTGQIPARVCGGGALQELLMINNKMSGRIPEEITRCTTLNRLRFANNYLSGDVPSGLWGLPHISLLEISDNLLTGSISPIISRAVNLSKLVISNNQINGSVPAEIGTVAKLYEFSAANNRLAGPLPASLGGLTELVKLDLHNNLLSGEVPGQIESWTKLSELNLANNVLTGGIPSELGGLPVLNYLDLSGNLLSGVVPIQLQNLKLNQFNLSDNQLYGPLPPLYSSATYRTSFLGNPGLCSELNGLCPSTSASQRHRGLIWLLRAIFIAAAVVLIAGLAWFYLRYRNYKKVKMGMDKSKWILTSFHKLGFSEYEILDSLDEDNVIGSGASGKVYKAVLSNGDAVAVKKLWGTSKKGNGVQDLVADAAFEAEVATLGKIRHKNIVKLWCCCTHKDCKLLVYEYMPNGSLGDFLRSSKSGLLDWPTRYKIALDAAEGLSYLHHDCVPPIVHRDVKSNNILLDGEFGARVADFGVAKSVEAIGKGPQSMSVIAGSCGYIAPEYAYTLRVNEKSDIYSFGVVILELITGKPPIDPEFGEKDLVKWVCSTMEQKGVDHVVDPKLDSCYREDICKVLNIGILCTSSLPINRPSMRRAVKMLLEVGTDYKNKTEKDDGKLSPYYYEDTSDPGSLA